MKGKSTMKEVRYFEGTKVQRRKKKHIEGSKSTLKEEKHNQGREAGRYIKESKTLTMFFASVFFTLPSVGKGISPPAAEL